MDKKKIGLFISGIAYSSQRTISTTVAEYGSKLGFEVEIYVIYGSLGTNILTMEGESNVINLPDFNSFDGIILLMEALDTPFVRERLEEKLRHIQCPVVYIRGNDDVFFNVVVENQKSIERIMKHFLGKGYTKICYLNGRQELRDSTWRYAGYRRMMEQYNLAIEDHMVYNGNFWYTCAKDAVEHFLSKPGWMPEAIVCANDFMAIGVIEELQKRNIRVPDDIEISGFDDIEECMSVYPTLTTLRVSFEEMARTAVDMIFDELRGRGTGPVRYISARPVYRGSTGHYDEQDVQNCIRTMSKRMNQMEKINQQVFYMTLDFEEALDEDDILRAFARYSNNVWQYKRMYLCFCDEEERAFEEVAMYNQYTEHMILRGIVRPYGHVDLMHEKFDRTDIIPKAYRDSDYYTIIQIHFKNHCFGYLVITFDGYSMIDEFVQSWVMQLGEMLERLDQSKRIENANEIRQAAFYDALTGILNRRGFEAATNPMIETAVNKKLPISVVTIDMDNLKKINDNYGHQEGDWAIIQLATALQSVMPEGYVCSRTGGDEFVVCALDQEETKVGAMLELFQKRLDEVNRSESKEFQIGASYGCFIGVPEKRLDFVEYQHQSDVRMYAQKRRKKAIRTD